MSALGKIFARNLERLIDVQRVRKSHLSRTTGISRASIDAYLAGKNSPVLETIEKFAEALSVHGWELLKNEDESPSGADQNPGHDLKACAKALLTAALGQPVTITVKKVD